MRPRKGPVHEGELEAREILVDVFDDGGVERQRPKSSQSLRLVEQLALDSDWGLTKMPGPSALRTSTEPILRARGFRW